MNKYFLAKILNNNYCFISLIKEDQQKQIYKEIICICTTNEFHTGYLPKFKSIINNDCAFFLILMTNNSCYIPVDLIENHEQNTQVQELLSLWEFKFYNYCDNYRLINNELANEHYTLKLLTNE